jgi:hypothetical protein
MKRRAQPKIAVLKDSSFTGSDEITLRLTSSASRIAISREGVGYKGFRNDLLALEICISENSVHFPDTFNRILQAPFKKDINE